MVDLAYYALTAARLTREIKGGLVSLSGDQSQLLSYKMYEGADVILSGSTLPVLCHSDMQDLKFVDQG